jgi:hypothetical protein
MHNFHKKQIALAVGAALAGFAGTAAAAVTQSVANKILTSAGATFVTGTDDKGLYSATGLKTGKIKLKFAITTDNAGSAASIQFGTDTTGGAASNAVTPKIGIDAAASAADTVNNFLILAADSVTTRNLANLVDSVATTAAGTYYTIAANFQDSLLGAGDRFKIDSVGALQYSLDSGTSWLPVKVTMQNIGDSLGFYVDAGNDSANTVADSSNTLKSFAATSVFAGNTIVPVATLTTRADTAATVPGSLVNGVTLNTYGALTALAASSLKVASRGTLDTLIGAVTIDTVNGALATSGSANSWTISFSPAAANLDTADTTADPDLYTAKGFNTGIATTNTPFTIDAASADSLAAVFSNVYQDTVTDSTFGLAAYLVKNAGSTTTGFKGVAFAGTNVITDAAQPVVSGSTYNSTTKALTINFSEPIWVSSLGAAGNAAATDVLEAVENIYFGAAPGTSLAAANFNADGDVDSIVVTNTNGVGSMAIKNAAGTASGTTAFLNQTLLINKRLSVTEPGEASNSVVDTTLDSLGFKSATGEILTTSNNTNTITVVPTTVTLAFDGESKAVGVMAANGKDVQRIDITYPYTISQDSTSSFKDHFKLKVIDGANGATVTPDPTSAFLDSTNVTFSGKVVSIALPTNLVLKNMNGLAVEYNTAWGDGKAALKFSDSVTSTNGTVATAVLDSNEINLPFYVTAAGAPLYTQETKISLTNSTGNSKVTGYLAKWLDSKVDDKLLASNIKIAGGKITNPGDKVATDLSIEIDATADTVSDTTSATSYLQNAISAELNKDKPGLIPAVVEIARIVDNVARSGDSNGGAAGQWVQAHARISTNRTAAAGAPPAAHDALYEVMLDPRTGAISGRLTGQLRFTATKGTKSARGLQFVKSDGDFTNLDSLAVQTTVATDGNGKANLMIGVDVKPTKQANLKDAFILAVFTDVNDQSNPRLITSAEPGMRNHLAFAPNLLTGKDGRIGMAGQDSAGVALPVDVTMIKPVTGTPATPGKLAASTGWQLVGVGALDRKSTAPSVAPNLWPRLFVTLKTGGIPQANWTGVGDTGTTDLALTMLGNKTGVASEATSGDTVSTIGLGANANGARFAFAFSNDAASADPMFFLTKTSASSKIPVGWSLISAPASWKAAGLPADVSHLLKVGAGYSTPVSWFTGDGASTNLVEDGEPVFVYAKKEVTVQ